jgi:hypothetical protein
MQFRLGSIAALALALPRSAVTYPAYVLAPFLLTRPVALLRAALPLAIILTAAIALAALRWHISPTAWAIEMALLLPLLAAVGGAEIHVDPLRTTRLLNLVLLILSIGNMVITQGFPLRLPYLNYLPDYYSALFGFGGARIVTLVGFFAIFQELIAPRPRRLYLLAGTLNLIMPNAIIVMVIGMACLLLMQVRKTAPLLLAALLIVAIPIGLYIVNDRLPNLNATFARAYSVPPKLFAYTSLAELYTTDPTSLFIGVGAGQYTSQPAQWASVFADVQSTFHRPSLPGLFAPEPLQTVLLSQLGPYVYDRHAFNSSINKPFTSLATMLAELGLPLTLFILWRLFSLTVVRDRFSMESLALFGFVFGALLVDQWHDEPWFGCLLLLAIAQLHMRRVETAPPRSSL